MLSNLSLILEASIIKNLRNVNEMIEAFQHHLFLKEVSGFSQSEIEQLLISDQNVNHPEQYGCVENLSQKAFLVSLEAENASNKNATITYHVHKFIDTLESRYITLQRIVSNIQKRSNKDKEYILELVAKRRKILEKRGPRKNIRNADEVVALLETINKLINNFIKLDMSTYIGYIDDPDKKVIESLEFDLHTKIDPKESDRLSDVGIRIVGWVEKAGMSFPEFEYEDKFFSDTEKSHKTYAERGYTEEDISELLSVIDPLEKALKEYENVIKQLSQLKLNYDESMDTDTIKSILRVVVYLSFWDKLFVTLMYTAINYIKLTNDVITELVNTISEN